MVTFRDGPAKGESMLLRRAPVLLRVVFSPERGWSALDLLEDTPQPDEVVTVYVRVTAPVTVHIQVRGARGGRQGGWYAAAEYRRFEEQPPPLVTRDNAMWREWCEVIRRRMPRLADDPAPPPPVPPPPHHG